MRILAFLVLFISFSAHSSESMRRCIILPIKDSVGGAIGYQVYQKVENYLRNSEWCYYQTNSEIINILGNYKSNLDQHLNNKDVLKIVSEKTKAGSLIRIVLDKVGGTANVRVDIVGDNGEDLYFSEQTKLNSDDSDLMAQTINNWLDAYSKRIPYDGRVIGVLGNQFTTDAGKMNGVLAENEIQIFRPVQKRKHPLLKEIVEWETVKVGEGKIFHVTDTQSVGNISVYDSSRRLEVNDWVIRKPQSNDQIKNSTVDYKENDDYKKEFGKLGQLGIFVMLGNASETINNTNGSKKIGGILTGLELRTEVWATREWWGSLEIGKKFGSFSKKEGNVSSSSNSLDTTNYKVKVGYRYLPMGFFYGPQLDGYIGYGGYSYGLSTKLQDGITDTTFKGLLFGTKGKLPIIKDFTAHMIFDFIFNPGYTEEVTVFGKDNSTSNVHFELGGNYVWSTNINIEGGINFTSNKAKFSGGREVKFNETNFRLGTVFTF